LSARMNNGRKAPGNYLSTPALAKGLASAVAPRPAGALFKLPAGTSIVPTGLLGKLTAKPAAVGKMPDKFAPEHWEQPRDQTGLRLLGDVCGMMGTCEWKYPLRDDSRRSYAGYLKSPFGKEQLDAFFGSVANGVDWQQPVGPRGQPIPRKTAWMVASGCSCTYRYGQIEVQPQEYPPWMRELMQTVMPYFGLSKEEEWPNGCNLNLYDDGGMSVGWHADDEKLFQGKFKDIRILSFSLGVARKFDLRRNWPEDGETSGVSMRLGNGDLCTMEGMTQKHFQHRVPKEGNVQGPRINLTWRWVEAHGPRCPATRVRPAR